MKPRTMQGCLAEARRLCPNCSRAVLRRAARLLMTFTRVAELRDEMGEKEFNALAQEIRRKMKATKSPRAHKPHDIVSNHKKKPL